MFNFKENLSFIENGIDHGIDHGLVMAYKTYYNDKTELQQ